MGGGGPAGRRDPGDLGGDKTRAEAVTAGCPPSSLDPLLPAVTDGDPLRFPLEPSPRVHISPVPGPFPLCLLRPPAFPSLPSPRRLRTRTATRRSGNRRDLRPPHPARPPSSSSSREEGSSWRQRGGVSGKGGDGDRPRVPVQGAPPQEPQDHGELCVPRSLSSPERPAILEFDCCSSMLAIHRPLSSSVRVFLSNQGGRFLD